MPGSSAETLASIVMPNRQNLICKAAVPIFTEHMLMGRPSSSLLQYRRQITAHMDSAKLALRRPGLYNGHALSAIM